MSKFRKGLAALAASAAVLVALPAAADDTIPLAAVMSETGAVAQIGTQATQGVLFAVDDLNTKGGIRGKKIDLKVEDDQANPQQSILSFNKLEDLSSPSVVFAGFSGPLLALAPLATRRKVLLVNSGAQGDALSTAPPYLINTIPLLNVEINILCHWIAKNGYKSVAILYENASAGILARDEYRKSCGDAGLNIVGDEAAQFGSTDYRPELLKIADMKPDVMLVLLTSGMPQMTQQFGQLGLTFKVMGTAGFLYPQMLADPTTEGWTHTQLRVTIPSDLNARFKAKYGADMGFYAFQYYNGAQIIFQAMDKVLSENKPLTGENVRAAVFEIGTFNTLIPTKFTTGTTTATAEYDINVISKGKDTLLEHVPLGQY